MTYIFIGPPASGKGTQAKLLANELKIPFYSIGALLRKKSETDESLAETIHNGNFAPPHLIRRILDDLAHEPHEPLVIDGIIRNHDQALDVLKHWKRGEMLIFLIEISDEEIVARALKRVEEGHKRADDQISVVKKRISDYRQSIQDIKSELIKHRIRLIEIDGMGSIEKVHETIMSYI